MTRIIVDPEKLDRFAHVHELVTIDLSKHFASDAVGMVHLGRHALGFMSDTATYSRFLRQQAEVGALGLKLIGASGASVVDLRGHALKVRAAEMCDDAIGAALTVGTLVKELRLSEVQTTKISDDAVVVSRTTQTIDVQGGPVGAMATLVTERFDNGSVRVTVVGRGEFGKELPLGSGASGGLEGNVAAGVFGVREASWDVPDEESARRLKWALLANLGGFAAAGTAGAVVAYTFLPVPLPNRVSASVGARASASGGFGAGKVSLGGSFETGAGLSKDGGPYAFTRVSREMSANVGVKGWPAFSGSVAATVELQAKQGLASQLTISFERLPGVSSDVGMLHVGEGEKLSAQVTIDLTKVTGHGARAAIDAWRVDPVGGAPMLEKLVAAGGPGISAELVVSKVRDASLTPIDGSTGKGAVKLAVSQANETVIRRVKFDGTEN